MALFSERHGYTKPRDTFIRENITVPIENAICSAFDNLKMLFDRIDVNLYGKTEKTFAAMGLAIWELFENKRRNDYYLFGQQRFVATQLILSDEPWFRKIDLIEFVINWIVATFKGNDPRREALAAFIDYLNSRFKSLGFAYRVVGYQVVEITSEEEIAEIESALTVNDSIAEHISTALKLLSQRPEPDFRNSVKESISAVECICREQTGKSTLGDALKEFKRKGKAIPQMLSTTFEKLYVYTNDSSTGIRHALMDDAEAPGYAEAKFMLVTCSAFINYIKAKV